MVGNANIVDATHITPLITEAHAVLLGSIGARYSLSAFNQNFTGSLGADLLGRIETLLAAGYLLQREYPQEEGEGESAEGDSRINRAMELLDGVLGGKVKLIDTNGNEFGLIGSGRSGRTINSTLPDWDDADRPAAFSSEQVF